MILCYFTFFEKKEEEDAFGVSESVLREEGGNVEEDPGDFFPLGDLKICKKGMFVCFWLCLECGIASITSPYA